MRWCTNQENNFNCSLYKNNTSTIKGITWKNNKWRARITLNNKQIHLGYFINIENAKKARQDKAKELFGEFLNDCEK